MGNPYAPPGENARPAPAPPTSERPGPEHSGTVRPGAEQPGAERPGAERPGGERPAHQEPGAERPTPDPAGDGPDSDRWPGALRPGPTPPPQRAPRPPVDSEVSKATARRSLHFFTLLLAAVVTSSLPLPWQVGSLVFVLVAIVVGIRALVKAWRSGVRGGVLYALIAGVAMAGMVALAMTTLLAVWPQQMERQRCLASAVTIAATQRCEAEFQESIERLAPRLQTPAS